MDDEDDFDFDGYQRMYASGVSEAAIRKKMSKAGFDPEVYLPKIKYSPPSPAPPRRSYHGPRYSEARKRLNFDFELEDGYYTSGSTSETESLAETMRPARRSLARMTKRARKLKPKFVGEKLTSGYYFVRSMFIKRQTPQSPVPPPRPVDLHFRTYSRELEASKGKGERGGGRGNRRSSPWSSESSRYSSQFSSHKSSVVSRKSERKSSQLSRRSTPPLVVQKEKERVKERKEVLVRPNKRKTSVFAGLQRFARRKSSVGPGVNAEHLTARKPLKLKGARKYLSGMKNSPSLKQRMQLYKSKVSSDQTVNNYVPQKKERKWKPPVVEAYKPSPNSLPHTKNGAVKAKAAIFESKNKKIREEDNRIRKAQLQTKSLANKAKNSQMSPNTKKGQRFPSKQKPTWSPSGGPNWSPQKQKSAESARYRNRRMSRSQRRRSDDERSARSDSTGDFVEYEDDHGDNESYYYDDEEEEALPHGWIKVYSEEWDEYFYVDTRTEKSTWERPA